jgi:hypothetical protein
MPDEGDKEFEMIDRDKLNEKFGLGLEGHGAASDEEIVVAALKLGWNNGGNFKRYAAPVFEAAGIGHRLLVAAEREYKSGGSLTNII